MKAILMSIKPEWAEKILNREKTIEVRKRFPKDYKGWVYIYCTKGNGKDNLYLPYEFDCFTNDEVSQPYLADEPLLEEDLLLNGKVVARFYSENAHEILLADDYCEYGRWFSELGIDMTKEEKEYILNKSCLTMREINDYVGYGDFSENEFVKFITISISGLEIFDEPKELYNFASWCNGEDDKKCRKCKYYWRESNESIGFEDGCYCDNLKPLEKAPQSWQYIEVKDEN